MLPPTPVSSSSSSSQKPAKPAQKRPRREAHACSQDSPQSASGAKGGHKDSPAPKRRKAEGKGSGSATEHKVRGEPRFIRWIWLCPHIGYVPNDGTSELLITFNKAVMRLCLKFYSLEGEWKYMNI